MTHEDERNFFYEQAKETVSKLTIEEKAGMCSGKDFWTTKQIERDDISVKSIMLTDGPHGLRKQKADADHLGLNESFPATCFPPACATACSFDEDLVYEQGVALGNECIDQQVSVLLGPGVNIKRSPLCGRNFEYFSEDPYLTGHLAKAFINGVQSKNVGTSIKHYLANNQEKLRMVADSVVDERALREIYMQAFEIAVKKSQPWTVMCSYNMINGAYGAENKKCLTDVLRDEWGFKGIVVSDWGAVNNRVKGLEAGLDLQMPYPGAEDDASIAAAVRHGILDRNILDETATKMIAMVKMADTAINSEIPESDMEKHNKLTRRIARESAVLLKNDGVLPLKKSVKVAVIGEFAQNPRFQGAGSSFVNSYKITTVIDEFTEKGIDFTYSQGYDEKTDIPDENLIKDAVDNAKQADYALVFAGLPDAYESEGFDRTHMDMPLSHNMLIDNVVKANPNTVVVLNAGSPVTMPWLNKVKGVLFMYLTGQNNGGAVYDLVFGDYSPCGKLAETFPEKLEDNPSHRWFAKEKITEYRESIFVGYRYYDKVKKDVTFPFGYGLSYASFKYSNLKISKAKINHDDTIEISFDIQNTGRIPAKEIVQVYVGTVSDKVMRPEKELKYFTKIYLTPQQKETITFSLDSRAFSCYNVNISDWYVEPGQYTISIGASSRDIRLVGNVNIANEQIIPIPDYTKKAPVYYALSKDDFDIPDNQFSELIGRPIPEEPSNRPYTVNSTIRDIKTCVIGRIFVKIMEGVVKKTLKDSIDDQGSMQRMVEGMMYDMPLRSLNTMTGGMFSKSKVEALVTMLNGNFVGGLAGLMKK